MDEYQYYYYDSHIRWPWINYVSSGPMVLGQMLEVGWEDK